MSGPKLQSITFEVAKAITFNWLGGGDLPSLKQILAEPSTPDENGATHLKPEMERVNRNIHLYLDALNQSALLSPTEQKQAVGDLRDTYYALIRADAVIRAQAADLEKLRPEVEGLKGDVRAAEAEYERIHALWLEERGDANRLVAEKEGLTTDLASMTREAAAWRGTVEAIRALFQGPNDSHILHPDLPGLVAELQESAGNAGLIIRDLERRLAESEKARDAANQARLATERELQELREHLDARAVGKCCGCVSRLEKHLRTTCLLGWRRGWLESHQHNNNQGPGIELCEAAYLRSLESA